MRTSTRIAGATAIALALTGAGSTAFAGVAEKDGHSPLVASESGAGGEGGSGGIGVNLLCGIDSSCSAGQGGAGGETSDSTTLG